MALRIDQLRSSWTCVCASGAALHGLGAMSRFASIARNTISLYLLVLLPVVGSRAASVSFSTRQFIYIFHQLDIMEKYQVVKVLNSGSFGKYTCGVFIRFQSSSVSGTAILVRSKDGALHVIKDIDISKLSKKERETTLQEVKILEALRHPNIVAFEEAFTQDGSLKIVMQ